MKVNGISASAYGTYSMCEFKYYLQYVLGFEDASGPSAVLGHLGHKVLEVLSRASIVKHPKDSKIWEPSYLWEIAFNHYYNKEPLAAEGIKEEKLRLVSKGIYELLKSPYTPIRDNTISAEVAFKLPIKEKGFELPPTSEEANLPQNEKTPKYFVVRGRIDRVDKIDDETIEVVDYKTGSRVAWDSKDRHKKTPKDLYEEIQPRMYHLAAKQLYPWAKNFLVTFIYIVDGGPITVPFSESDLPDTKEMIRKRLKSIQANDNPQRNIGWQCRTLCCFGKDGTCNHVWQEKDEMGAKFIEQKYAILNDRWKK